jgi:nickel-type superoxide dismutase maturation protease
VILQVFRIKGNSLAPHCREGDYVVASGLALRQRACRAGDLVVFDHPEYGRLIKRVEEVQGDGWLNVRGLDIDSVDSRLFGALSPTSIRGRVIWHIRARG